MDGRPREEQVGEIPKALGVTKPYLWARCYFSSAKRAPPRETNVAAQMTTSRKTRNNPLIGGRAVKADGHFTLEDQILLCGAAETEEARLLLNINFTLATFTCRNAFVRQFPPWLLTHTARKYASSLCALCNCKK
jgi:hypothetical protein